jgi:hypothetical protein
MTLPHISEGPILILFPIGIILAAVVVVFVVRVITVESKKSWYRSPTFLIPLAPLVLLASFFTCRGAGLIILLVAAVALAGGALLKRLRRGL